jgi:hypothetical protein
MLFHMLRVLQMSPTTLTTRVEKLCGCKRAGAAVARVPRIQKVAPKARSMKRAWKLAPQKKYPL